MERRRGWFYKECVAILKKKVVRLMWIKLDREEYNEVYYDSDIYNKP